MAYTYTALTPEETGKIDQDRIRQFELEHYNHGLNLVLAAGITDAKEKADATAAATAAQAKIEKAIASIKSKPKA